MTASQRVGVYFEDDTEPMKPESLAEATESTIGHYDQRADSFWEGTKDHDVSQNRQALLRHLQGQAPYSLLDLGCGPGRDLIFFKGEGHVAVGLDGSSKFCEMARNKSGCQVLQQNFVAMELPVEHFNGIFANASLFHVPTQELPRVLLELHAALRPGGVLFASNPRGNNQEGFGEHDARFGSYWDVPTWQHMLTSAGFVELEHYYRPPKLPRDQQPWFASVWRKG